MKTKIIKATSRSHAASAAAGAEAIKAGKLVAFATETTYGIAAAAVDESAMERLRQLKSRPKMPFSVHVADADQVKRYVRDIPPLAARLIEKGWPGPITLLLPTGGALADRKLQRAGLYDVLTHDDYIGIRCPDHPASQAMLLLVESPVVAPSANLAGGPSPRDAAEVLAQLDGRIDLLIDSGATQYTADSTIVKFDDDNWEIVRGGVLSKADIKELLMRRILFVCTGNTCRSPMAEGIARKLLTEREGVGAAKLKQSGWEVLSAGLWATDGMKASPEAIVAIGKLGASISSHRSRKLTTELINSSDLVFCMTEQHAEGARRLAPLAAERIRRLGGRADIPDPIGAGEDVYCKTAEQITKAIRKHMDKGII